MGNTFDFLSGRHLTFIRLCWAVCLLCSLTEKGTTLRFPFNGRAVISQNKGKRRSWLAYPVLQANLLGAGSQKCWKTRNFNASALNTEPSYAFHSLEQVPVAPSAERQLLGSVWLHWHHWLRNCHLLRLHPVVWVENEFCLLPSDHFSVQLTYRHTFSTAEGSVISVRSGTSLRCLSGGVFILYFQVKTFFLSLHLLRIGLE